MGDVSTARIERRGSSRGSPHARASAASDEVVSRGGSLTLVLAQLPGTELIVANFRNSAFTAVAVLRAIPRQPADHAAGERHLMDSD